MFGFSRDTFLIIAVILSALYMFNNQFRLLGDQIQSMDARLTADIRELRNETTGIHERINKIHDRINEIHEKMNKMDNRLTSLEATVRTALHIRVVREPDTEGHRQQPGN